MDRKREAQALFNRLKSITAHSETPAVDIFNEVLMRVETFIYQTSQQTQLDPDTRKSFEDLYALLVCTQQMTRDKVLAERLQRIVEASQKSLESFSSEGEKTKRQLQGVTQDWDFMSTWRPLFYLLIRSGDFLLFITDCLSIGNKIARNKAQEKIAREKSGPRTSTSSSSSSGEEEFGDTEKDWDLLYSDIQRVFLLMAREPNYHDGIDSIFTLLDQFVKAGNISPEKTQPVIKETEALVASFTGKPILERWKSELKYIVNTTQNNEELRKYFSDVRSFIKTTKSEAEVRSEVFKQRTRELTDRGRALFKKFSEVLNFKSFFATTRKLLKNFQDDKFIQALRHQAGIVRSDFTYIDSEGREQLDTHMITNLQKVILPVIADSLKYVPIPRIGSSTQNQEYWIDNIVLSLYDILPDNLLFHIESYTNVSLKELELKESKTHLIVELDHIITEVKDIEFYFKQKSGIEISDSGRVSLQFKGNGASLRMIFTMLQESSDSVPRITEGFARFKISDMDIKLDKATLNHDIMLPMLQKLFKGAIQSKIEKEIESNLSDFLKKLADNLNATLRTMNRKFGPPTLETAKQVLLNSPMAQVFDKRRENSPLVIGCRSPGSFVLPQFL